MRGSQVVLYGLEGYSQLRVDIASLIEMVRNLFFSIQHLKQLQLRKDLSSKDLQFHQRKLQNFQLDLTAHLHCAIFFIIFVVLIYILVDSLSYGSQLGQTSLASRQLSKINDLTGRVDKTPLDLELLRQREVLNLSYDRTMPCKFFNLLAVFDMIPDNFPKR